MSGRGTSASPEKQVLVTRCAAQRTEFQEQARSLARNMIPAVPAPGGTGARAAGPCLQRIAFDVVLALAGARRFASAMAIAGQILLLAKLFRAIRGAARRPTPQSSPAP
jgi:hypothetical protein